MTERQKSMVWKRTQAHRDRFNRVMARQWKAALMAQIQPVIDEVTEATVNEMETRIPHLMGEDPIRDQLVKTVEVVGVYFAKQSFGSMAKAMGDNWTRKEDFKPTDEQWVNLIMALLGERAGERITAIVDESRLQAIEIVKATLLQAAEEGLGMSQMSVLLRDNLNAQWGDISTYRASRIARTETTMASNLGSLTGAKEAGIPMKKVWLSTRDSRTRRKKPRNRFDHYGKWPTGPDGEKRDMDEDFTKTGESLAYPGDYSGSAGNIINCRCSMYYEPITVSLT